MFGGVISSTVFSSLVINSAVIIVLLLFSKESLRRLKNVLDILNNGAYTSCPFFTEKMKNGRRWYDEVDNAENTGKGGEDL